MFYYKFNAKISGPASINYYLLCTLGSHSRRMAHLKKFKEESK